MPSLFIIKIQRKYVFDILFKPKEWSRTAARGGFVYDSLKQSLLSHFCVVFSGKIIKENVLVLSSGRSFYRASEDEGVSC
jgi:hypothetical protein